jgi:hypothetical protein
MYRPFMAFKIGLTMAETCSHFTQQNGCALTKIFINFLFLLSDGLKRCHDEVNKEVK